MSGNRLFAHWLVAVCCLALAAPAGPARAADPPVAPEIDAPPRPAKEKPAATPRAELGKPEPAKSEPARVEPVKIDPPKEKLTDADRAIRLIQSIAESKEQLRCIHDRLANPEAEYRTAEAEFQKLDGQWQAVQGEVARLNAAGQSEDAAKHLAEARPLREKWEEARKVFDLLLQERRTLSEKAAGLAKDIEASERNLARLNGQAPPAAAAAVKPPAARPPEPREPAAPPQPAAALPGLAGLAAVPLPSVPAAPEAAQPAPGGAAPAKSEEPVSKELTKAKAEAEHKQTEVEQAKEKLGSVVERLERVDRQIELESKLLETARENADLVYEKQEKLTARLKEARQQGAGPAEVNALWEQLQEASAEVGRARQKVRDAMENLTRLQAHKADLLAEQAAMSGELEQREREAERALQKVAYLENPFTPRNVLQWLLDHGVKIVLIVLTMFSLQRMIAFFSGRLVKLVAARARKNPGGREPEDRAQTLVGVFRYGATVFLLLGGGLMLMDEVGVPVGPLMGGAAVFGIAVAFGAQNLIRDYFSGFMILLEDQYGINDVIQVGNLSGIVEKVNLRVTVIRDLSGVAHFIPNGNITSVSNMTHSWSRALFGITVAYKEDTDFVMQILVNLANELRRDAVFGAYILDAPEMLGVDELGDHGVTIKFYLKTRPLKQWMVQRELLRRIKRKFDELGIEIPFPQQVVHHRREGDMPAEGSEHVPPMSLRTG